METELMPCPVCGSSVNPAGEALLVGVRLFCCSSRVCAYVLIDTIPSREAHNTLARRAEIGRIVEAIVAHTEAIPDDGRLFIGHGGLSVGVEDDFGKHRHIARLTLLDALRALEREVNDE